MIKTTRGTRTRTTIIGRQLEEIHNHNHIHIHIHDDSSQVRDDHTLTGSHDHYFHYYDHPHTQQPTQQQQTQQRQTQLQQPQPMTVSNNSTRSSNNVDVDIDVYNNNNNNKSNDDDNTNNNHNNNNNYNSNDHDDIRYLAFLRISKTGSSTLFNFLDREFSNTHRLFRYWNDGAPRRDLGKCMFAYQPQPSSSKLTNDTSTTTTASSKNNIRPRPPHVHGESCYHGYYEDMNQSLLQNVTTSSINYTSLPFKLKRSLKQRYTRYIDPPSKLQLQQQSQLQSHTNLRLPSPSTQQQQQQQNQQPLNVQWFSMIREPFDRLVSLFEYSKMDAIDHKFTPLQQYYLDTDNFTAWADTLTDPQSMYIANQYMRFHYSTKNVKGAISLVVGGGGGRPVTTTTTTKTSSPPPPPPKILTFITECYQASLRLFYERLLSPNDRTAIDDFIHNDKLFHLRKTSTTSISTTSTTSTSSSSSSSSTTHPKSTTKPSRTTTTGGRGRGRFERYRNTTQAHRWLHRDMEFYQSVVQQFQRMMDESVRMSGGDTTYFDSCRYFYPSAKIE